MRAYMCLNERVNAGYLVAERARLENIVEQSGFDFQNKKVLEASRRMDNVILHYYRKNSK